MKWESWLYTVKGKGNFDRDPHSFLDSSSAWVFSNERCFEQRAYLVHTRACVAPNSSSPILKISGKYLGQTSHLSIMLQNLKSDFKTKHRSRKKKTNKVFSELTTQFGLGALHGGIFSNELKIRVIIHKCCAYVLYFFLHFKTFRRLCN
jgi:hypothetical protein